MPPGSTERVTHPRFSRRLALQAGAVSLLGLGTESLSWLRAQAHAQGSTEAPARSVIFVFLSGGLSQLDSFDLKPEAPDEIRGEFAPIATATPGLSICEHLPLLAQRSRLWSLVRSLTHGSNDHSAGHHILLTGRSDLPSGFDPGQPRPADYPSIAAVASAMKATRNNLPPAVVLPERLVHNSGRVIPGQFAGLMGHQRDPWFLECSPFVPKAYGAFPEYEFDHQDRADITRRDAFAPSALAVPEDFAGPRMAGRLRLREHLEGQCRALEAAARPTLFERHQNDAVALLTDPKVRQAFDLAGTEQTVLSRYGDNSFGWSLLMSYRLVEAGVSLVQVNLGNNETWDTHGNAFPHLKDNLFPPTDRALAALLDDLHASGLLDSTLIVVAGEFGRTPKISSLPQHYKLPGRDHWGRAQSVLLAGGGVKGGRIIGSTDRIGGHPASDPQTPENLAATIYKALGIPREAAWKDAEDRPHFVYRGDPIAGLV